MRNNLALLVFILFSMKSFSQNETTSNGYVKPEFKGGIKAFHSYLKNYLRYPPGEYEISHEGNVTAKIFISQDGNIKDVSVTGENAVLNSVVKRVLTLMPAWEAGKLNGTPIDTTAIKKIYFSVNTSRIKGDSTIYECMMYSMPYKEDKESLAKQKEENEKYQAAKALYDKGVIELQNKNAANALDLFNQAGQQGFHNVDLYYNRGVANFKTGNKEGACQDWLEGARRGDSEALDLYNKKCK